MRPDNIHGFRHIDDYVNYKLGKYAKAEKNFASLFASMFDESDNVMIEYSDGYRITKITYGEYKESILHTIPVVALWKSIPRAVCRGRTRKNRSHSSRATSILRSRVARRLFLFIRMAKRLKKNALGW